MAETFSNTSSVRSAGSRSVGRIVGACAALLGAGVCWTEPWSTVSSDERSGEEPYAFQAFAGALSDVLKGPGIDSLNASVLTGDDYDGDGLVDSQEYLLLTSPFENDTDGDSYSDTEEVARQSDPRDATSIPTSSIASATLAARGEGGNLRLVLCVHEPDGQLGETFLRIGVLAGGEILTFPLERFLNYAELSTVTGSGQSTVSTIDIPVAPLFVQAYGHVTFFLAAGNAPTMAIGSASKIDIGYEAGELILHQPISVASQQPSQGGGSIRQPIPITPSPPTAAAGWVPGSVCYQRSEVVAANGPKMVHRVVEADCVEGWDSYCSPACSLSVGDEYETIDPFALLGS